MSKVRTFSRVFPGDHKKKGEPTYFVEKILNNRGIDYSSEHYLTVILKALNPDFKNHELFDFWTSLKKDVEGSKGHTIRGHKHFAPGDEFSPRVWSGQPYKSKQITFLPDLKVVTAWDVEIVQVNETYCNFNVANTTRPIILDDIARNDGLNYEEFAHWFKFPKPFVGQIICWDNEIVY